jgi:hypothetical protein
MTKKKKEKGSQAGLGNSTYLALPFLGLCG